jgi:hypothetical protein
MIFMTLFIDFMTNFYDIFKKPVDILSKVWLKGYISVEINFLPVKFITIRNKFGAKYAENSYNSELFRFKSYKALFYSSF